MFDGGYFAGCTARDLGWKRVHWTVHERSRALEQVEGGQTARTLIPRPPRFWLGLGQTEIASSRYWLGLGSTEVPLCALTKDLWKGCKVNEEEPRTIHK